jgi:hypothetical protein
MGGVQQNTHKNGDSERTVLPRRPCTTQPSSRDAAVSDEDAEGEKESKNKGSFQRENQDHLADAAIMLHEV